MLQVESCTQEGFVPHSLFPVVVIMGGKSASARASGR